MATNHEFACGAVSKEQAVLYAERMVKFAAEPVMPGELVKGQIRNASERLQLDFGTVRRAWYRLSGPEVYPIIYNAWLILIERIAAEQARAARLPWAQSLDEGRGCASSQRVEGNPNSRENYHDHRQVVSVMQGTRAPTKHQNWPSWRVEQRTHRNSQTGVAEHSSGDRNNAPLGKDGESLSSRSKEIEIVSRASRRRMVKRG